MIRRLPLLLALLGLLPAAGCDEGITDPDALAAYFTLWGGLDPTADTQAIRVVPIRQDISGDTPEPLDAVVTSTDLATGATTAWRDSVITFDDGTVGHVFLGDVDVVYSGRYRIDVARSDGATTTALVHTPSLVEPFREATAFPPGDVLYPVFWPGAPQLNAITVRYDLIDSNCEPFSTTIPFQGDTEPSEFGWSTSIHLAVDADRVLGALGRNAAVTRITLSAEVASMLERPPGGVFDPEVLIEPGTFTNVQQGFGLVTGAYRRSISWVPDNTDLVRAGFGVPGPCVVSGAGSAE